MVHKKVSIIGLGLIGGSIAKALRERLDIKDITAVNSNLDAVGQAIKDGVISRGFTEVNNHVFESDLIFICTPVKYAFEYLCKISGHIKPDCIVTDVCSTKAEIIDHVGNIPFPPCFVGGHPMAGSEKTGYGASSAHLFENAYYILSPSSTTTPQSLKCMEEIVSGIGAIPVVLDAREHDRITGAISHVPHIIASALVNMVKEMDTSDGKMQMLAAGGFRDITRIASSSPEMWESITLSNNRQISQILDCYIKMLIKFKGFMKQNDSRNILSFFESAKLFRDSISSRKAGLITPLYNILVDVVDKPGIIGEIATILGSEGINIKNINISNSREFEQGCLRITLPDSDSQNRAVDLLVNRGYRVFK